MDSQNYKCLDPASQDWEGRRREEEEKWRVEERNEREEHKGKQEVKIIVTKESLGNEEKEGASGSGLRKSSNRDEKINTEATWYETDQRVICSLSSLSSGFLSAARDDRSAKAKPPTHLDILEPKRDQGPLRSTNLNYHGNDNCICFAELSKADLLPSPSEATTDDDIDDDDDEEEEGQGMQTLRRISKIPSSRDLRMIDSMPFERSPVKRRKKIPPKVPLRTSSIPRNKPGQPEHRFSKDEDGLFLTPSPNPKSAVFIKDTASESEDEFFDAQERFTPPAANLSGWFL